jgi:hypothetical protein
MARTISDMICFLWRFHDSPRIKTEVISPSGQFEVDFIACMPE